jgi:predicted nucleic acid-binding protein
VILVDANLILYAEDSLSRFHQKARLWWDEQLSGAANDFAIFSGLRWSNPIATS